MKTLPIQKHSVRLGLTVALLASVSIMTLDLIGLRKKIEGLRLEIQTQTVGRQNAEVALGTARKNWETTSAALTQTRLDLESARMDQARARGEASVQTRRADQLRQDLASTVQERNDLNIELRRFNGIGMKPEEIVAAKGQIKSLRDALASAQVEMSRLRERVERLTKLEPKSDEVALPKDLAGKVIASDPKWHFVVVNAGADQGVVERGELLVSRNGKLVARVRVTRVRKDCCVADVVAGWELGEVSEGDRVVPAFPRS